MAKSQSYLERVEIAAGAASDAQIAAALADRCGITPDEVQAIQVKIEPARAASRRMNDASEELDLASRALKAGLAELKANLSALRSTLNDNFSRDDPLYKKLGLAEDQPIAQEALLAYSENVFTQGRDLTPDGGARLAKRKWDTARFTTALAGVAATRAANQRQEAAKGASLAATAAFYDALDALDEVFRPFAKNARTHLADRPGALEKMELHDGLPVKPSRPLPAAARKKPAAQQPPTEQSTPTS
jgi:hypothetical protein